MPCQREREGFFPKHLGLILITYTLQYEFRRHIDFTKKSPHSAQGMAVGAVIIAMPYGFMNLKTMPNIMKKSREARYNFSILIPLSSKNL
jgi:hypothetical protein